MYSDAPHGEHCNSRTFPMRCKYCGQHVFYFSCDHGCKVIFDSLGPPWPEHKCMGLWASQYGKEFVEMGFAHMMMLPGIERKYTQRIEQANQQRVRPAKQEPHILRQAPYVNASTEEDGIVRELIRDVDVLK